MASAKATIDHDEIRRWVEERDGYPARVKGTELGDDPGVLRIDYPGYSGEDTLERIPWDEWLDWFDRHNLAFLYSDKPGSRFSKLVDRATVGLGGRKRSADVHVTTARKRPAARKAASSKKRSTVRRSASTKRAPSSKKGTTSSKKSRR